MLSVKQFLADKHITVLEHPPYSQVLAPYDFYLHQKGYETLSEPQDTLCHVKKAQESLQSVHGAADIDEAWMKLNGHSPLCRTGVYHTCLSVCHPDVTFRRAFPVFRVVRCSSVHCFQTRINA
ncbi:hypothetical protein TNCV_4017821 [Trichonephila clavipes]|nr:hypothetical protein TNCV_4017821 [Trichonephila clavipes]